MKHIFRMSRVWFWHQGGKFVVKTCHKKSSIFSECPECDFDTREENLLEKHVTENHTYFQNVQSVILTLKKKIVEKTCHRKSSIFSECPECDFEPKKVNLLKKYVPQKSVFRKESSFYQQKEYVHESNSPYKCELCPEGFDGDNNFKKAWWIISWGK